VEFSGRVCSESTQDFRKLGKAELSTSSAAELNAVIRCHPIEFGGADGLDSFKCGRKKESSKTACFNLQRSKIARDRAIVFN